MNTHIRTTPRQPHVLAVDDEPLNLVVIEGALAALDCRIVAAHDAATAMDAMLADRPDLVLLDVMMPGESGLALCRRMRSHPDLIDVPVILVTALDAATSRTVGLSLGADDYLEKPIDIDRLLDRVRSMLATSRHGRDREATPASVPGRRSVEGTARDIGLDPEEARLLGLAATVYAAARLGGAGEQTGLLADAMARAAGVPPPSGVASRLATRLDDTTIIDEIIQRGRP